MSNCVLRYLLLNYTKRYITKLVCNIIGIERCSD